MSPKIPVSVAIITKNEKRNITNALNSVRDFDDIVVVDSFSTDGTVEICRNYTDRIYQHEWIGFSSQKQKAVDYAKNAWVMILDADELVTPELKHEMMSEIAAGNNVGFYVPRKSFFLGRWIRHSGWWPDYTLRIFRKDSGYVEPREVHEKVVVKGSAAYLKNPLIHNAYVTLNDYIRKMDLYSGLAAEAMFRQKGLPSSLSIIINPVAVFVKMYILRQGFRDGRHGFILAVLYAFQTFLKYAKAWERSL